MLILTRAELTELTGYRRPCDQLAELHRLGFHRARRSPVSGAIILERAHFEAVASGRAILGAPAPDAPRLRPA